MGKFCSRVALFGGTALSVSLAASHATAAIVANETFDYTVGERLVGRTTPFIWQDPPPTSPTQPSGVADTQVIVAGSLTAPGRDPGTANSLIVPRTPGSNISRLEFAPVSTGPNVYYNGTTAPDGMFFSFSMKLTNIIAVANGTGANQAGNATAQLGGFIAGFSPQNLTSGSGGTNGGMSATTAYGGQMRIRRAVDSSGNQILDVNNNPQYQIGLTRNNPAGFTVNFDSAMYGLDQTILVVGSYKFVSGATNDELSLWINPTPGEAAPAANVSAPTGSTGGADVADIKSFYFRSDTVSLGDFQMDELQVGTSYADVTAVPEPASLGLLAIAGGAVLSRRRKV